MQNSWKIRFRRRIARWLAARAPQLVQEAFAFCFFTQPAESPPWHRTTWLGQTLLKPPTDLWNYHEIIFETRPDLIIETGTWRGASAHYFAHQMDLIGAGSVLTIDPFAQSARPNHPRLTYVTGSSTDPEVFTRIQRLAEQSQKVMVVLDADHSAAHVAEELKLYSSLVTPGCFLIVEDTCVNGHPLAPDFGPGPMEALDEFLANNDDFDIDDRDQKFFLTFSPKGFLRRREAAGQRAAS